MMLIKLLNLSRDCESVDAPRVNNIGYVLSGYDIYHGNPNTNKRNSRSWISFFDFPRLIYSKVGYFRYFWQAQGLVGISNPMRFVIVKAKHPSLTNVEAGID